MDRSMVLNLKDTALSLPAGWNGRTLADFGCVRTKLFKVDPAGLAEERHSNWDEALLMLDGELILELDGAQLALKAGDFCLIPRGVPHRILSGCHGSFVLLDPEPSEAEAQSLLRCV